MDVSRSVGNGQRVDANAQGLRLSSVRFDETGAAELDGGRPIVFIPRAEVVRIELAYTSGVSNRFAVGIIGLTLLAVSLGLPLFSLIASGGSFQSRAEIMWGVRVWYLAAFAFPAVWMIQLATRKRWVVVVHGVRVRRHLIFQNPPEREAMEAFLEAARARFGYQ